MNALHPSKLNSVDDLRQRLLSLIGSGQLEQNGKLPTERELSREFDIGRRQVRLAIEQLTAEGLVWRKQGSGNYVGQPADPTGVLAEKITGETNVLEVMEARLCIEAELAGLCAFRMLPDEVTKLRTLAERHIETSNPAAIELWDAAFHRLIAQCARNRPMLTAFALLDKIRSNDDWVAIRQTARSDASLQVTYREHINIVDAIATGHPETARDEMKKHLSTRFDALRDCLVDAAARLDTPFFNVREKP